MPVVQAHGPAPAPARLRALEMAQRGVLVAPAALMVAGLLLLGLAVADRSMPWLPGAVWLAALGAALVASGAALALLLRQAQRHATALAAVQQALAQHQRSAQLLDAIAQCSPDAIYAKDLQGRYLFFNRAAAALCGRDPQEMLGRDDAAIFGPDEVAQIQAVDRHVVASGEAASYEVERQTALGQRSFLATKGPLRDAQGLVIGSFGISRDITQRRQSEDQLRQLSLAVEQSSESIVIANLRAQMVYVNQATLDSTGYARDELLGANMRILQSGRTPPETYADMWAALASGLPWKGLLFNRRKDGSEYVEFSVMTPVRTPQGRITHFIAVKEDVTEKQRMGAELDSYRSHLEELVGQRTAELAQAKRVAETANAAKSSFLATMSHEIRTPMNGIVGLVEVLSASPLSTEQGALLRNVRESAFSLLKIIDGLLDFSKIEAGHLVLEHTRVDLRALVEGTCDSLQAAATDRQLLRVFVDPTLPAQLTTDALRLRQIINNLVGNALKFSAGMARPGRVALRVDGPKPGQLRLTVSDNGIGMDAAALARVFEPFVQAEDSTTRRYGGTGLGLSIVQKLVQAFGGSIEAQSLPDRGSRFVVQLPLQAVPHGDTGLPGPVELPQVDCHLLLADAELEQDWTAYLQAAGVAVFGWPDVATLRAGLYVEPSADAVLLYSDALPPAMQAEARQLAEQVGAGVVTVGRGARRKPYHGSDGGLRIDADALHRDTLLLAVAMSAGRGAPVAPPAVERSTPRAARGTRVLVAEDNPVNQTVIRLQLELLGLDADIAADGLQALQMWRNGRYAMLLTDLHMPGLDGCELAERIRAESPSPVAVPLIAVTASASDEERARCRAAGLDDYLCKPITPERLAEVLRRWLPDIGLPPAPPPPRAESTAEPVLDETALPALVGNNPPVLRRIRHEYLLATQASADALREAVAYGRWADASAVAHRLKSSSRAVGAMQLARLCAEIETAVRRSDPVVVKQLQSGFDAATAEVQRRIQAQLQDAPEPPAAEAEAPARSRLRRYVPRELSDALQHGQLRVHYQPQVALADGRLLALEALVRWQHPSDGLVLPEHFLPLAEERGLLDALGTQVLDQALTQAARWRDHGLAPTLSINLAFDTLQRPELADELAEKLQHHGLAAPALRLELAEARLAQLGPLHRDTLARLRQQGIGLSIDDFGTGQATLAELRDLPFDQLKIDPSLVHGCSQSTTRRASLKASLTMARQAGLRTVAKGVEDAADWDTVRDAGCDAAQGYFVARPMTADQLPGWLSGFAKRYPQIA